MPPKITTYKENTTVYTKVKLRMPLIWFDPINSLANR